MVTRCGHIYLLFHVELLDVYSNPISPFLSLTEFSVQDAKMCPRYHVEVCQCEQAQGGFTAGIAIAVVKERMLFAAMTPASHRT